MSTYLLTLFQVPPRSPDIDDAAAGRWDSLESLRLPIRTHLDWYHTPQSIRLNWADKVDSRYYPAGVTVAPGPIGSQSQLVSYAAFAEKQPERVHTVRPGKVVRLEGGKAFVLGATTSVAKVNPYARPTGSWSFARDKVTMLSWATRAEQEGQVITLDCGSYYLWLPEVGLVLWLTRSPFGLSRSVGAPFKTADAPEVLESAYTDIAHVGAFLLTQFLGEQVTIGLDASLYSRPVAWLKYHGLAPNTVWSSAFGPITHMQSAGRYSWLFETGDEAATRLQPRQWVKGLLQLTRAFTISELLGASTHTPLQKVLEEGVEDAGLDKNTDIRLRDVADSAGKTCAETCTWVLSSLRYWSELVRTRGVRPRPTRLLVGPR